MPDDPNKLELAAADPQSVRAVRLETSRLILREHFATDLDAVLAYASDPEVAQLMMTAALARDEVAENLARIADHRFDEPRRRFELAIARRDDAVVLGWVPLILGEDREGLDAEIGWTLAPAHWGQGYAAEAAAAMLTFAFERLSLHRVWARCRADNAASIRVMEKLGMQREACFRRSKFVSGAWVDVLHYAILEDEWWDRRRETLAASPGIGACAG